MKNQKLELATKRKAHAETLEIAKKKLKAAIEKNMSAARVAQAIMEGASKLKDDETSIQKQCSSLEKKKKSTESTKLLSIPNLD